MGCWAIVPLKDFTACKSRLARSLSSLARRQLVQRLLTHVTGVLRNCPEIDNIVIVSPQRWAVDPRVEFLQHDCSGLNEDLTFSLDHAGQHGAASVMLIPPDLPLLRVDEVVAIHAAMLTGDLAIAPDRHHVGTNALAFRLPQPIPLCFGKFSFASHLERCRDLRKTVNIVHRPGLALDIDEPSDLELSLQLSRRQADSSALRLISDFRSQVSC